ncbi:hypothetical protein GE061_011042 [Apolygus lucorum]|uniref:Uncharacterized protein n=1 Tax=Apolygus lucorum TaxID=248454 RepID=A0A8S9XWL4_APOLU|nr:hypothetical protein GE061_011042 [Apolygus lucorum]
MWGQERGAGGDQELEFGASGITYVNDPPERDIGPNTSRNVIIRDLRQMANDYSSTNIGLEMSKMKKLESIYTITANATLKNLGGFKAQVKEKKTILDELSITNSNLKTQQNKKGPLAITDGSGIDILDGVNDHNIDQKLKQMENRIVEAKRAAELNESEFGIQEALSNYHEVFKQSMQSMENIAKSRSNRTLPKMSSFRQFINDTEKNLPPEGQGDEQVTKALKELKRLNKYNTFDPEKLPFIPELTKNFEEELAHLNIMYNDILEDLNVKEDMVDLPMTKFLEHTPKLKPAKSILKKIEDSERKRGVNAKSKRTPGV